MSYMHAEANPALTTDEAAELTRQLSETWFGDTLHADADQRAMRAMAHGAQLGRVPFVREQLRRSRKAIAPYADRVVTGITPSLAIHTESGWHELPPNSDDTPHRVTGTISGVKGRNIHAQPNDIFRIGIFLTDIVALSADSTADQALIPIRDFKQYEPGSAPPARLE